MCFSADMQQTPASDTRLHEFDSVVIIFARCGLAVGLPHLII